MKATGQLHDLGQSLWLDNITRDLLTSGTLERYIDELSVTGLTSNPTIFDQAIKNSTAYDAAIRQEARAGQVGRGPVLRAGARGPHAGRRPVPAHLRADQRRGRLGVAGSVAAARPRHGEHARRRQGSPRAGGASQPADQDPGHQRRAAGHRRGDLRRHPGQRDAAVLPRALPRGRRGVPARHRASHRGRAQARRGLGGLGVHQPLGRRGHGQGAGRAAQPARHRHRQAHLQGVRDLCSARRAGSASTTPAPGRSACCGPAPAPRTPRPPTSCTSRRSPPRSR